MLYKIICLKCYSICWRYMLHTKLQVRIIIWQLKLSIYIKMFSLCYLFYNTAVSGFIGLLATSLSLLGSIRSRFRRFSVFVCLHPLPTRAIIEVICFWGLFVVLNVIVTVYCTFNFFRTYSHNRAPLRSDSRKVIYGNPAVSVHKFN